MIQVRGLSKSFNAPLLRDFDLVVPEGCFYGLIGPAACGKSVLFKLIAGLLEPDSGSIHVGEREVTGASPEALEEIRAGLGMLFQNNALFDFMSVAENIAFPLRRMFSLSEEELAARVTQQLISVGLDGFQDRMPSQLSGGQRKRIGVARAAITEAPILLYDEPAAGLDPVTSRRLFDLLRERQQDKKSTLLVISSDLDRLLDVSDRVGMLHDGRLIFEGTPDEARTTSDPYVQQFVQGLADGPL
jgi:phospholipid/cholesterol/gamma-HCH transport system ATP-binding protein